MLRAFPWPVLFREWFKQFRNCDSRFLCIKPKGVVAANNAIQLLFDGFNNSLIKVVMLLTEEIPRDYDRT